MISFGTEYGGDINKKCVTHVIGKGSVKGWGKYYKKRPFTAII